MPRIRLNPSGHEIETEQGDTVLSALERQGYAIANNCRAGACGECKTKVLSGDFDQGMVLSMALSRAEREDGYGLMCMATPLSDVLEIDYGTVDALPKLFPPRTQVPHVVVDHLRRTDRLVELHLRPIGKTLRFWPGQYVLLGNEPDVPARSYSLANAPRPDGELILMVTRVDDGVASTWIHEELKEGDTVLLDGPYGTFVGDPSTDTPVVCLAAGSGLAPIMSLADGALRRGFPHPVTLVVSSRTEEDRVALGMMQWWEQKHPNFHLVSTQTRSDEAEHTKRIPDLLPELFPSLAGTSVFIAGSPDFVDDCEAAARELGVEDSLIFTEGHTSQLVTPSTR